MLSTVYTFFLQYQYRAPALPAPHQRVEQLGSLQQSWAQDKFFTSRQRHKF